MSTFDDAVAHECQHASCTMDDPLTAAMAQCQDDFWSRRLVEREPMPESPEQRIARDAQDSVRLPSWFPAAAVAVLALVSAISHFLPWGFAQ